MADRDGMECRNGDGGPRPRRPFGRDENGIAIVEFALLAVPFFLTIFAIFETSMVFLAELTLDQSVDRVARQVRTGEIQDAKMSREDFRKAICEGVSYLLDCDKLQIDLKVYADFGDLPPPPPITNGALDPGGFGYELAGPETITALRVYYEWPIHTDVMRASLSNLDNGKHLLSSMAAFRTEPY